MLDRGCMIDDLVPCCMTIAIPASRDFIVYVNMQYWMHSSHLLETDAADNEATLDDSSQSPYRSLPRQASVHASFGIVTGPGLGQVSISKRCLAIIGPYRPFNRGNEWHHLALKES